MLHSTGMLPPEAASHYDEGVELRRLAMTSGQLELARTQELLLRFLPPPPAIVYDVGGGPGVYSCWLARSGYEAHLIDAMPLHVRQAEQASQQQPDHPIASIALGDARRLNRTDDSVDAILLFGPLYHLIDRKDRVLAWREARRVLKPNGLVLGTAISRFASTLDGLKQGFMDDPDFVQIVAGDLRDGQHRNPTNNPFYFTTTFFHRPEELKLEIEAAGLRHLATLGIEGPGWLLQNFSEHWENPMRREHVLNAARAFEQEPAVLGISAHLLAVAQKNSAGS